MRYQVTYNKTTKAVQLIDEGDPPKEDYETIGTFTYNPGEDSTPPLGNDISHTLYQEVQQLLYEEGITDMAYIAIDDETTVTVKGITLLPSVVHLEEEDTVQLVPFIEPVDADDKAVTYVSSDTNVATVTSGGLVTAVNAGEATITVTTNDGSYEDESLVYVYPDGD